MPNWETIQVNASTINDFLVILGTPWWINGLVNGGFACWLVCRLVELLCGGFANGWAHREVKPWLRNMERSQRRQYRRSTIMAYLLLNKRQHFKAVKFKYKGWALYPKFSTNLAKQEQEIVNFGEYDPSQVVDFLKKSTRSYLLYLLTSYVLAKRVEYTEDTFASASLEICAPGRSYFRYSMFPSVMLASLMHSPESPFQTCNSFY